jgi:hypothetical protein
MIEKPIDQIVAIIVHQISFGISHQESDVVFDNEITLSGEYCQLKGLRKRLGDDIRAEAMPEAHIVIVPKKYP